MKTAAFGSRFGFILAAIGMMVGTGNIWRFPRVVAANGGAAFIIALTVAIFVWAIPLLLAEIVIGRKTRLSTVGGIRDFVGRKFTWMGAWLGLVPLLLMFYYSVVTGWSIKYFVLALQGAFTRGEVNTEAIWALFTTTPLQTILFHMITMIIVAVILNRGVKGGIEIASKILVPSLFVLLAITAIRALFLPGAVEGLKFLFKPDLSYLLLSKTWLEAFSQAAWSTGAGWGLLLAYAVYTKKDDKDIVTNTYMIAFGDTTAALLAALAVLPTVFSLSATPEAALNALSSGNTGLTLIYLPALFSKMSGGYIIGVAFFLALCFAAISSMIGIAEVNVLNLQNAGFKRSKAVLFVSVTGFILGIPSAYSLNFLNNQDWVWGVALLVSGLLMAIVMMKYGVEKIRREEINQGSDMHIGKWWSICIKLFPVMFAMVFGWWVYQSVGWYPNSWWNILETFTPGTMLFQWLIVIIPCLILNNWFANWIKEKNNNIE